MPVYRIKAPDGKTYRIEGPAGATQEQVQQAIIAQHPELAGPGQPARPRQSLTRSPISAESDARAVAAAGGAMAALRGAGGAIRDMAAGAVRGAGDLGATIMAPGDMIADAVFAARPDGQSRNQARRAGMTEALGRLGANTDSPQFAAGRVGAQIAGTAGIGGVIARGARAIPVVANNAPRLLNAIESGGFALGAGPVRAGAAARVTDAATRAAGGAIAGGAAAGLVDPENAATGAAIGAALPAGVRALGVAGERIGALVRGPEQPATLRTAVEEARQAGYVIPPTQARGSLLNRLGEGFAGKLTTAQNASARNQGTTNRLAARALGLPEDTIITAEVLANVRAAAGQQYEALGQAVGTLTLGNAYQKALDDIAAPFVRTATALPDRAPSPVIDLVNGLRVPQIDGASAVEVVKQLRTQADDAFRAGNTDVGRAARSAAKAIEDAMEKQLAATGNQQALKAFRDARALIARAHTIGRALDNPEMGTVNARKLGEMIKKGKPLMGDLAVAGRFGTTFRTAAQPTEAMGSLPQLSPLDYALGLMGGGGMVAGGGVPAAALMFGRPAVRATMLSPIVQNSLVQPAQSNMPALLDQLAPATRLLIAPTANAR